MEYQILDRDDIQKIFDKVLADKGLEIGSNDLDQQFIEFLNMPCNFDFTKPITAQVERQATIFWTNRLDC